MQLVSGTNPATLSSLVPAPLTPQDSTGSLDRLCLQRAGRSFGYGDQKPALAHEFYRHRRGLDLDPSVSPAHLKRCPRLQASLASYLSGELPVGRPNPWLFSWYDVYHQ